MAQPEGEAAKAGDAEPPEGQTKLDRLVGAVAARLGKHARSGSITLYLLGLVWVTLFPLVCISTGELKCRGTYFSENALNAGSSVPKFSAAHVAQAKALESQLDGAADYGRELSELMLEMGASEAVALGPRGAYAVMRPATGADRREAIILVAKLAPKGECCSGVGEALVLMEIMSKADWLSKNLIVLAAETHADVRGWVRDYHGTGPHRAVRSMPRAGAIIGGMVLQKAPSQRAEKSDRPFLHILAPGLNGQLPNLDLVNTAVKVTPAPLVARLSRGHDDDDVGRVRGAAQALFETHVAPLLPARQAKQGSLWLRRLENLARFMAAVALGPTGIHASLLPFDIHAVTLSLEVWPDEGEDAADAKAVVGLCHTIEQIMRSLSNLEEKFHQSYFLYVLPDLRLFVSIGEYFGPLMLVLSPLVLVVIVFFQGDGPSDSSSTSRNSASPSDPLTWMLGGAGVCALAQAVGVAVLLAGVEWRPAAALGAASFAGLAAAGTRGLSKREAQQLWGSAKALGALLLVVAHSMAGMVNFPFSYFAACATVPFFAVARPGSAMSLGLRVLALALWLVSVAPLVAWPYAVADPVTWGLRTNAPATEVAVTSLDAAQAQYGQLGALQWAYAALVLLPAQLLSLGMLVLG